jgi:2-polyprenyl-6-methoxyphenol hydroxylase-like FAD-dependent oxidoreductase
MTTPRNEVLWQVGLERSFGIIPISNTQLYIAGVSKEPGNPRFDHRDLLPLMQERFADFGGPAREMMSLVTESSQIVYTPIHEIIMPMPWSKERVVLIGDAAHASTPFWAQGASMAVEDAIVLARLVAERDDIMALLAEWERRRYPRCAFVQEGSKNTGVRGHAPGEDAYRRSLEHIRLHAQHDIDARYARLNEPI